MFFGSGSGVISPTTPQVTEAVPFNFQTLAKKSEKVSLTVLPKYIIAFKKMYKEEKKKLISSFRTIPLKLFLKSITNLYTEKSVNAKNSRAVRHQSMAEYLYDNTYNKYGIAKLTEKKLKEICLTIMMNYKKYSEIELFSYFIGLTDKFYTNDDLTFYFIIERIYSSNHLDEDATPNEVSNEEKLKQTIAKIFEIFLEEIANPYQFKTIINKILNSFNANTNKKNKYSDKGWIMIFCIERYRDLKHLISQELDEVLKISSDKNILLKQGTNMKSTLNEDIKDVNSSLFIQKFDSLLLSGKNFEQYMEIIITLDVNKSMSNEEMEHSFEKYKTKIEKDCDFIITYENLISIIIFKGLWASYKYIIDNENETVSQ